MNKIEYTDIDIRGMVFDIIRKMNNDNFIPDYIVGINRGGLTPALMLSQYLNIPMHTLDVSLHDPNYENESNCFMSEDAFGYTFDHTVAGVRKKILLVDDINDTGATLNWIKKDWEASCLPSSSDWVSGIWNKNVRFATLINNVASDFSTVDYFSVELNKAETPSWVIFPWEKWWKH